MSPTLTTQQPLRRTDALPAFGGAAMTPPGVHPRLVTEDCAQCARDHHCASCFEEVVRRHQVPLLHFLLRRAPTRHDAEDLLQETFLIAYRKLNSYRAEWKFKTWLFTIANRQATSARRRHRAPVSVTAAPAIAVDPCDAAQQQESRSVLWDAARDLLDPDAFTALWLTYAESMPAAEVGAVLGRSPNAIRILLHRARAKLAGVIPRESTHES